MTARPNYPTITGSLVLLAFLAVELVAYSAISSMKTGQVDDEYAQKIASQNASHEKERTSLIEKLDLSKHLATGRDAYERIFNGKQRDVNVLIEKLAAEALPSDWTARVEMEEFTKTLLILQPKIGQRETQVEKVFRFLLPILDHSRKYLGNVAIYNTRHQCRLFLDENLLGELIARRELSEASILQAKRKGSSFSRYNATPIAFEESHGHFLVPVVISGANGTKVRVMMLLDTGASTTMISKTLAQRTGDEDLAKMPTREFSTANGSRAFPMVERQILIEPFGNTQRVAVALDDETNLLGVDFFQSRNYIIDSPSKRIYVWAK